MSVHPSNMMNDNADDFELLDEQFGRALPSNEIAARLKQRILDGVRADIQQQPLWHKASKLPTVRAHEGEWLDFLPKIQLKILRKEKETSTFLLKVAPGGKIPAHDHPHDEECFLVEGEIWLGGELMQAGDYQLAPKGMPHGGGYSETGCVLMIRAQTEMLSHY